MQLQMHLHLLHESRLCNLYIKSNFNGIYNSVAGNFTSSKIQIYARTNYVNCQFFSGPQSERVICKLQAGGGKASVINVVLADNS